MTAVRDSETSAESMGIHLAKYQDTRVCAVGWIHRPGRARCLPIA